MEMECSCFWIINNIYGGVLCEEMMLCCFDLKTECAERVCVVRCELFLTNFWVCFDLFAWIFLKNWNETLRISSRWSEWGFDFFCERVGCLNLLDFYWVLTKLYRFFREFLKGIVVWFCDMYLKVGMMVFWHHSINDFCECNTHELNILILEFIISPCSMQHDKFIVLEIVSYQLYGITW